MSGVSDAAVAQCVRRLLESQDLASTTVKQLIALAEQRLQLEQGQLLDRKPLVKATIAEFAAQQQRRQEQEEAEDEEEEEEEEEEESAAKRKREKAKPKPKAKPKAAAAAPKKVPQKQTSEMSPEEYALSQLRKLAKAARKGPTLFKGLPGLPVREQIVTLRRRLRELDFSFSDVPTDQEIRRVEQARQRELDLEGIDPSLIISGSRRSRKSATSVAEPVSSVEDEDEEGEKEEEESESSSESDSEAEFEGEDEEEVNPPKRRKEETKPKRPSEQPLKASNKSAVRRVSDSEDEAEFEF